MATLLKARYIGIDSDINLAFTQTVVKMRKDVLLGYVVDTFGRYQKVDVSDFGSVIHLRAKQIARLSLSP